jgi:hypothetical protein
MTMDGNQEYADQGLLELDAEIRRIVTKTRTEALTEPEFLLLAWATGLNVKPRIRNLAELAEELPL